jgi:hypothetical protein
MTNYKSAPTPFLSGVKLEDDGETPLVDNTLYKHLVGILLYLTHSKLDLSYAVGVVFRFRKEPHELHWKAAKCILPYVHGAITFGIHYSKEYTLDLIEFTDYDWVGDSIDCKYTFGYSLRLGFRPICWSRKKQDAIALSSAEAEYRGVVNITIQTMWIQHFHTELGIQFNQLIVIWCDH